MLTRSLHDALPNMEVDGTPAGSGVKVVWYGPGDTQVGEATRTVAAGEKYLTFESPRTRSWGTRTSDISRRPRPSWSPRRPGCRRGRTRPPSRRILPECRRPPCSAERRVGIVSTSRLTLHVR